VALYDIAQTAVSRIRPPAHLWIGSYSGGAFPSGHVQTVAFFGMLAFVLTPRPLAESPGPVLEPGCAHCADAALHASLMEGLVRVGEIDQSIEDAHQAIRICPASFNVGPGNGRP